MGSLVGSGRAAVGRRDPTASLGRAQSREGIAFSRERSATSGATRAAGARPELAVAPARARASVRACRAAWTRGQPCDQGAMTTTGAEVTLTCTLPPDGMAVATACVLL